jgi:helix-turn-helix protein
MSGLLDMLWQSQRGAIMQVTIAEAAERLRLSERTIRRRVKTGELPGSQLSTPQGFVWMVDLPDEWTIGQADSNGEVQALRGWIDQLSSQLDAMQSQLEAKDKQIEQLHVLLQQGQASLQQAQAALQQAQAALPVPKNGQNAWWQFWRK